MSPRGPGYATPLEATKGPGEEILYVTCVQPNGGEGKHDLLATIDVDPKSSTYCKIIHRTYTHHPNEELHHSGWNTCSSCHEVKGCHNVPKRNKLLMPCLASKRIYVVDTGKNPRAPEICATIEPVEFDALDLSYPHTTHCLPSGEIMVSTMGDNKENAKGDFMLIDAETLKVKGTWTVGKKANFGYDFWYQPFHDVMVASEWAAPNVFKCGFYPDHLVDSGYGKSLNIYSWKDRELKQVIDLGRDGFAPLELRFLHNPKESQGYVGCCVFANVFRFFKKEDGSWDAHKVISVPAKKVSGWVAEEINGMMSDIIISLDDRYLYFSNWLHGDVRQYDITDRESPKLTGQVFLGGLILSDSGVTVVEDRELSAQPDPVFIKGKRLYAGPQMLQLSLDGKRLYVTSSLYSPFDRQYYPEVLEKGGFLVKIDVNVENGGMTLDKDFLVEFDGEPDGPILPHEMRYPGGDVTSDIWLADV